MADDTTGLEQEILALQREHENGTQEPEFSMSDDELLTELSAETLGFSRGFVRIRIQQRGKSATKKLPIKSIDLAAVGRALEELTEKERDCVLDASKHLRRQDANDQNWLYGLVCICHALCQPVKIRHKGDVVWVAEGAKQDIVRAMLGLCETFPNGHELELIAVEIARLSQRVILSEQDTLGNF